MPASFMIYRSYSYSESLIAEQAVKNNMQPLLAGQNADQHKAQAKVLGLKYQPLSLDDPAALEVAIKNTPLILNCTGRYIHTFKPTVEACLRTGCRHLILTYNIHVIEDLAALDTDAPRGGVMLLPGVKREDVETA